MYLTTSLYVAIFPALPLVLSEAPEVVVLVQGVPAIVLWEDAISEDVCRVVAVAVR